MIKNINTKDFLPLLLQHNILIVDVREEDEYAMGHIPGAMNLPLSCLHDADFPENKDVVFYCRSGYRSQIAAEYYYSHRALNEAIRSYFDYKDGYLGYIKAQQAKD